MTDTKKISLENGSKVAVIGGGPAGSFFTYFILDLAKRMGKDISVDIYDPKDFSRLGPAGCNHCGGIISESLVQIISTEGIRIPKRVVRRGIDAYVLHTEGEQIRIETPLQEKRIAAMHRGGGPLGTTDDTWHSFDGFLLDLVQEKKAHYIKDRIKSITFEDSRPRLVTRSGAENTYDLLVGATGINTKALALFEDLNFGYRPPKGTKTFICEFRLGTDLVQRHFGSAMHVFLLNLPRLEFAALIPKGDCVTMCLLGEAIDKDLINRFIDTPEVNNCFPPDLDLDQAMTCQCRPQINIKGAGKPYSDHVVLIGDCAVTKLYKNGIGAAYVTAKAAATTALLQGISNADFKRHYWPVCRGISGDNLIGNLIFTLTSLMKTRRHVKHGIIQMATKEQGKQPHQRRMSTILWDTFTGNAPYREIILRGCHPVFLVHLLWEITMGNFFKSRKKKSLQAGSPRTDTDLGKVYRNGETIIHQGDGGDCLYVIRSGKVVISRQEDGRDIVLAVLSKGDFFGEMALFDREIRSSGVRARGKVRLVTIDKSTLLRRIQEDPSLAFRILEKMSLRIRGDNNEMIRLKSSDRRNWDTRSPDGALSAAVEE